MEENDFWVAIYLSGQLYVVESTTFLFFSILYNCMVSAKILFSKCLFRRSLNMLCILIFSHTLYLFDELRGSIQWNFPNAISKYSWLSVSLELLCGERIWYSAPQYNHLHSDNSNRAKSVAWDTSIHYEQFHKSHVHFKFYILNCLIKHNYSERFHRHCYNKFSVIS